MLGRSLRVLLRHHARRLYSVESEAIKEVLGGGGSGGDDKFALKDTKVRGGGGRAIETIGGGNGGGGGGDTLAKRLLRLTYANRSAVTCINEWIQQGRSARKYELNRAVRELRKFKRYKHALEICEWMRIQKDIKLLAGDYALHLDLVTKVRGLSSAEKFFEDLPDEMRGLATCSALLHTYVQNKSTDKAEALMQKMSECGFTKDALSYNRMISLYISTGQLDKVPTVIKDLEKNTSPDVVTYNLWLSVCALKNNVEMAEKIFLKLTSTKLEPDWVTYSTLTNLYLKNDLHEKAKVALKEMEKGVDREKRVAFSSLITLQANLGDKDGVERTLKNMRSFFRKMSDAEYMSVIASFLKIDELEEAEKIYTEWEAVSPTRDARISNLLLAAYINENQMHKADSFLDHMVEKGISPNYTTFELLTSGYLQTEDTDKVMDYFKKAIESVKKWEPNEKLVREIFGVLEKKGDTVNADELLNTLRNADYVTTELYNSLLRTYVKAGLMPVLVAERMAMDEVKQDEETKELIQLTSKLCISDVPGTRFLVYCTDNNCSNVEVPREHSSRPAPKPDGGADEVNSVDASVVTDVLKAKPKMFKNRFLNFVRLGSVVNNAAESFFKSEIRRRLFVTAVLIVMSRIGYFIPLPGFDRRLIPENYLSFVSGSVDELGDLTAELKLSLFQLGISPQIGASILMQVLCHLVPSLVKLRKEGLDGHEKIKSYIWWISLGFAIVEAVILACYSLPYSIFAATYRVKHVMVTTFLLVCGAMTTTWICDKITDSGFGQGSSLIICAGILTGYTDTLYKMLSQLSGTGVKLWLYILAVLGVFTVVTMWAVVVTEGCRKIKLQYYGFKLASAARDESPITEVEPYIPFNINPSGMQPVLTTTYLLAFPSILAGLLGSPFWGRIKEILNPESSLGAAPWVYYSIYAFFVFVFNIFDIANLPKEIADYLNKMGARIPNIKPGKATIEHLTKVQASTRFWGGLLLSILATTSSLLDHYLRSINQGFSIGFTSVLIIVGSIIELRRSYQAYNVMPTLSKALQRYGV
ncbi:hypothetical protein MKW94_006834 [Papaver nudicaule]|uniref:Uncharacterized protein n=2 Tax=Magnoliopsida TaxID=3398 RepID=A0AA41SKH6_PAPNU|nr:hypothetical protein [Papaver nudicaule]